MTEPSAEPRPTPTLKFEIDPFRTAMPCRSLVDGPNIAVVMLGSPGPLSVKPARSIVTKSAVISRQAPVLPVKVISRTSLYGPDLSIVWHYTISTGPFSFNA